MLNLRVYMLKHELITVGGSRGGAQPRLSPPPSQIKVWIRHRVLIIICYAITLHVSKQHCINSRPSNDGAPFNQVVRTLQSAPAERSFLAGILLRRDRCFLTMLCRQGEERIITLQKYNRDYWGTQFSQLLLELIVLIRMTQRSFNWSDVLVYTTLVCTQGPIVANDLVGHSRN